MNFLEFVTGNPGESESGKGAKIPWNDPEFSRRMLENHLSQEHDWASRRQDIIARHVAWVASHLEPTARILDMGCGPGFYTRALAEYGHSCVGVDFSPASIEYARKQAAENDLKLEYILCDIREYRSDTVFDCILMTFGEFNVFTGQDAAAILANCSGMLRKDGILILEAHTFEAIREAGLAPATWQRSASGLFSSEPHLCLQENIWNAEDSSTLSRYFILDAARASVRHYASFMQAYTLEEYRNMLDAANFCSRRVSEEEWPTGNDFQGKLHLFHCKKVDTEKAFFFMKELHKIKFFGIKIRKKSSFSHYFSCEF